VINFAGGISLQAVLLVSGVVLTRALGPTNRGNIALLILVTAIASQLGGLGIPYALTYAVARGPAAARRTLRLVWNQIGLQALLAALVALAALALLTLGRPDYVKIGAATTALAIAATVYERCGLGVLQGLRRFLSFNLLRNGSNTLFSCAAAILWISGNHDFLPYALAWCASQVVVIPPILWSANRAAEAVETDEPPPLSRSALLRFGRRSLFGGDPPVETYRIDQGAVAVFLAPAALGYYVAALAFTNLPRFIAQSFSLVATPMVAGRASHRDAVRTMWRFFWLPMPFYVSLAAILWIAAPFLTELFFGATFARSAGISRILLVATVLYCARRVLSDSARGAGYPGIGSIAEVVSFATVVPAFAIAIPIWGLDGVAYSLVASSTIALAVLMIGVKRLTSTGTAPDVWTRAKAEASGAAATPAADEGSQAVMIAPHAGSQRDRTRRLRLSGRLTRNVVLLGIGSLLVGAVVFGLTSLGTKQYTTTATLRVSEPNEAEELFGAGVPTTAVSLEREAATTEELVARAAKEDSSAAITVKKGAEYNLISIKVTADDADRARDLANKFAREYVAARSTDERDALHGAHQLVERKYEGLTGREKKGEVGAAMLASAERIAELAEQQTGGAVVRPAGAPTSPSSPKSLRNGLIAALLAFLIGACALWLLERAKGRFRPRDAQDILDLPILAIVGEDPDGPAEGGRPPGWSGAAEAVLDALRDDRGTAEGPAIASVLVTSDRAGEGTGELASALAEAAAATVVPVAPPLIGDVRSASSEPGCEALRKLRAERGLVVLDAPPLGVVANAFPLLREVDAVILVCRLAGNTRERAEHLSRELRRLDAPVRGLVVNLAAAGDEAGDGSRTMADVRPAGCEISERGDA
jgi:O-antigen/teichoic acid export membrane protein